MMLMPQERKKAITLIIEGMGSESSPEMGNDRDFAMKACCKTMLDCIKREDAMGLADCLKEFMEMCNDKPEMEY